MLEKNKAVKEEIRKERTKDATTYDEDVIMEGGISGSPTDQEVRRIILNKYLLMELEKNQTNYFAIDLIAVLVFFFYLTNSFFLLETINGTWLFSGITTISHTLRWMDKNIIGLLIGFPLLFILLLLREPLDKQNPTFHTFNQQQLNPFLNTIMPTKYQVLIGIFIWFSFRYFTTFYQKKVAWMNEQLK